MKNYSTTENINSVYNNVISLFNNTKSNTPQKAISIKEFAKIIQTGKYTTDNDIKNVVMQIRNQFKDGYIDKANELKSNKLIGVTLSANCKSRDGKKSIESKLINHTTLFQIDIDYKANKNILNTEKFNNIYDRLKKDKHTLICFISPSGNGIKLAVQINGIDKLNIDSSLIENQKLMYDYLDNYYKTNYNLTIDKTKDLFRLCFLSYDPNILVNENAIPFQYENIKAELENEKPSQIEFKQQKTTKTAKLSNNNKTLDINETTNEYYYNKVYENALKHCIEKILSMKDGEKHNTRLKLSYMLGGYVSTGIVSETKVINDIYSAVSNTTTDPKRAFKDIKDGLNDGYKKPFNIDVEVEKYKEIIRESKLNNQKPVIKIDVVNKDNGEIIETKLPFCFWSEIINNNATSIKIEIVELYEFIKLNGYAYTKINDNPSAELTLIRVINNIVEETNISEIRNFLYNEIEKLPEFISETKTKKELKEKFSKTIDQYINKSKFDFFFDVIDINQLKDCENNSYFYFKNGFVEVHNNGMTLRPYSDLKGMIWKKQIIDRDFKVLDFNNIDVLNELDKFEYNRFLKNICTDREKNKTDTARLTALKCVIGYLLHTHKSSANSKAIIFTENRVDEEISNGRTGKGLLMKSIGMLRNVVTIDGKNFSFDSQFALQNVSYETQLLFLDDVKKHFDFERCYSWITEGIEFERKGKDRIKLSYEKSPKFVISSNYGIKGNSESDKGRKYEMELLSYYNATYTPIDEFKRRFFEDWNTNDWNKFYNIMLYNVMLYLRYAAENSYKLPEYYSNTIEYKKLLTATNGDFIDFFESLIYDNGELITTMFVASDVLSQYIETTNDKKITQNQFTRYIKTYADSNKLIYTKLIKKIDKKSTICFELSKKN